MADFRKGQRVAWSHQLYMHAPMSVIYDDALPGDAVQGTVVGPGDAPGSWAVALDGDAGRMDLTAFEIVRIAKAV